MGVVIHFADRIVACPMLAAKPLGGPTGLELGKWGRMIAAPGVKRA
jgi:hypothetical protein